MSRKALIELRNDLLEQSQSYETRGLTEEHEYEQLKSQIQDIDIQLKKIDKKEVRNMIEVEVLTPNDVKEENVVLKHSLKDTITLRNIEQSVQTQLQGNYLFPLQSLI